MNPDESQAKSVWQRFATMNPSEFTEEVQKIWGFGEKLLEQVGQGVSAETITPLQGIKVASCIAGSLLGYEEFHPRGDAASPELATALYDRVAHRERELAAAGR